MRFESPLDDLLRNRSSVRVLRVLTRLPDNFPVSAREVARRAGVSHPTASAVMGELAAQGLVRVRRAQWGDGYELNRSHVLTRPILDLFGVESRLREEFLQFLAKAIRRAASDAVRAYAFGSFARGEMTPESDLDVAVVARRTLPIVPQHGSAQGLAVVGAVATALYLDRKRGVESDDAAATSVRQAMEKVSGSVRSRYGNRLNALVIGESRIEPRHGPTSDPGTARLWERIQKEGIPIPLNPAVQSTKAGA